MNFPVLFHTTKVLLNYPGTSYMGLSSVGNENWVSNETDATAVVPIAMQLTNMTLYCANAPGRGQSVTYTVRKNGVDTGLTITLSDTTSGGTNNTVVSFAAGDTVSVSATATSVALGTSVDMNFLGTAASQVTLVTGATASNPSNAAVNYALPTSGVNNWNANEGSHKAPWAAAGTLANFYVRASVAPGGVAQYVYTVRKNGVDTGMTVTMSGVNTLVSDTTHTVAVVAGDLISISATPTGTPSSPPSVSISFTFTPTTTGDCAFVAAYSSSFSGSTSVACYGPPLGAGYSLTAFGTEVNLLIYHYPCILKSLYASISAAPGGTATLAYALRKNRIDTPLAFTLGSGATTGNATGGAIYVSEGDTVTLGQTPTNTPASSDRCFGYCVNFIASSGFFQPF